MAFTGRPNVTDAERKRKEGFLETPRPKYLLLKALKTMIKYDPEPLLEILKGQKLPQSKSDTNFDKWQKKNRGL